MDFIEKIFGISPDGGSGSLELLYAASVVVAAALAMHTLYRRRSLKKSLFRKWNG